MNSQKKVKSHLQTIQWVIKLSIILLLTQGNLVKGFPKQSPSTLETEGLTGQKEKGTPVDILRLSDKHTLYHYFVTHERLVET